MSGRGHFRRAYVGASPHARALVHTLEMKQRYDNARANAVSALLTKLSASGIVKSIGNNQWDVALKDGAWVRLLWYPDWNALEATVSDRELHRVDDPEPIHKTYAAILDRITAGLRADGVTAVGSAIVGAFSDDLSSLKAEFARLNDAIRSLNTQVSNRLVELASTQAPEQLRQDPLLIFDRAKWSAFFDRWRRYRDELDGASAASWQASTKVIESALRDWEREFNELRVEAPFQISRVAPEPTEQAASRPGRWWSTLNVPAVQSQSQPPSDQPSDGRGYGVYIAIGAAVLAAITAISVGVRNVGKSA